MTQNKMKSKMTFNEKQENSGVGLQNNDYLLIDILKIFISQTLSLTSLENEFVLDAK